MLVIGIYISIKELYLDYLGNSSFMNTKLVSYLREAIWKYFSFEIDDITLSEPPKKNLGDYAFGCFVLAKNLQKNPALIAQELAQYIVSDNDHNTLIKSVSAEGPYLNIFMASAWVLEDFVTQEPHTPSDKIDETVIIDYIWANVWKPLHIGHMCTPNIGQSLINTYKKLWYNVISDSHIGDWGIIFGKLIWAWKNSPMYITKLLDWQELWYYQLKYGDNNNWKAAFAEDNLIKVLEEELEKKWADFLMKLYQTTFDVTHNSEYPDMENEVREEFKKLSKWNKDSIELWSKFTECSISTMGQSLIRLNVDPQYHIGESFYEWIWLPKMWDYPDLKHSMHSIVEELITLWIATKNDDGSVGVEFEESLKMPSCILQKRDGTHGYLASDLATIKYRIENWNPEKIVYSVDVRQQLHLRQAFEIAHAAGWTKKSDGNKVELIHAHNGFISLKEWAMSTRSGKIVRLDVLLDEAEKRAGDIILEKRSDIQGEELDILAETIGIGAIKYWYLKKTRETDVVFDWDEFMTFEWNSGPYIQYAYVRAHKIVLDQDITTSLNSVELSPECTAMIQEIWKYHDILKKTIITHHPHLLCQYGYSLARVFNSLYNSESILSEEDSDYKNAKLYIVSRFMETLEDVFWVLWIDLPTKM